MSGCSCGRGPTALGSDLCGRCEEDWREEQARAEADEDARWRAEPDAEGVDARDGGAGPAVGE